MSTVLKAVCVVVGTFALVAGLIALWIGGAAGLGYVAGLVLPAGLPAIFAGAVLGFAWTVALAVGVFFVVEEL